jgi:tRNA threonylcarbamoyladenosine modification (KEOPS) complex  Pcc1 subunit
LGDVVVKAEEAKAVVEFAFRDLREARAVQQALMPEEALPASARCEVKVERRKNVLCLQVKAKDTAALRAALNSFIRWIIVARDMVERGEK